MEARRKQVQVPGQRPSREAMQAERKKAGKMMIESLQQVLHEHQAAKFKALTRGPRAMGPLPGEGCGEERRRPEERVSLARTALSSRWPPQCWPDERLVPKLGPSRDADAARLWRTKKIRRP
jgi:hypothetical protein